MTVDESGVQTLLLADTVFINTALSVALGSIACDRLLKGRRTTWAQDVRARALGLSRAALAILLGADILMLWLQSATLGDRALFQAWDFAWQLLSETHFGHRWIVGFGALLLALAIGSLHRDTRANLSIRWARIAVAALLLFAWSRAAVSHAAGQGDVSPDVIMECIHVLSAGAWTGIVIVAAVVRLPTSSSGAAIRADATHWVRSLSSTATVALLGVLLTGSYNVWRSVASLQSVLEYSFGQVLIAKLGLVLIAMCLGALNRMKVMPGVLDHLEKSRPRSAPTTAHRRFRAVLVIESVVLSVTLFAAALLSTADPMG